MLGFADLTDSDTIVQADSLKEVQERLDQLGIPFRRQEVVEGGITIQQVSMHLHSCNLTPPSSQMHAPSGHTCRTPAVTFHLVQQVGVGESFRVHSQPLQTLHVPVLVTLRVLV